MILTFFETSLLSLVYLESEISIFMFDKFVMGPWGFTLFQHTVNIYTYFEFFHIWAVNLLYCSLKSRCNVSRGFLWNTASTISIDSLTHQHTHRPFTESRFLEPWQFILHSPASLDLNILFNNNVAANFRANAHEHCKMEKSLSPSVHRIGVSVHFLGGGGGLTHSNGVLTLKIGFTPSFV